MKVPDNGGMRIAAVGRNYGANERRIALSRNIETRQRKT